MPDMCCVPDCRGNYPGGPKVSTFGFPKDNALRRKWLSAIKRDNFTPTIYTRVCELHFQELDIERSTKFSIVSTGEVLDVPLKTPRLVKGAVPCKLPYCPEYLEIKIEPCESESPQLKKPKLESDSSPEALEESTVSVSAYAEEQSLTTLDDIANKFSHKHLVPWTFTRTRHYVCFMLITETPHPLVEYMVSIGENMQLSVFYRNTEITSMPSSKGCIKFPMNVDTVNLLEDVLTNTVTFFNKKFEDTTAVNDSNLAIDILDSLAKKLPEKVTWIRFLQEQIKLLNSPRNALRYSCETVIFCSFLYAISPRAYEFVRNANLIVWPPSKTLKKVCSYTATDPRLEQNESNFLHYISTKKDILKPVDKLVALKVEEINLKPYIDSKSRSSVGGTDNSTTSACVFMINSLLTSYKEVVHILGVKPLDAEELHCYLSNIILRLEEIGFEVLVVVSDNHVVNREAMSMFASPPALLNEYKHPKDPSRSLLFAVDPVNILKNLRNDWINVERQEIIYPDFETDSPRIASFETLKNLVSKGSNQLIKFGWSVHNVKWTSQIINPKVVTALRELGPKLSLSNYEDTAAYLEILCRWWDVANVKPPFKGFRHENPYEQPITKDTHHIFKFLNDMVSWLDKWDSIPDGGKLTRETHVALRNNTDVYLKIAKYCLYSKNCSYVLLGHLQTDKIEERFGKYS